MGHQKIVKHPEVKGDGDCAEDHETVDELFLEKEKQQRTFFSFNILQAVVGYC